MKVHSPGQDICHLLYSLAREKNGKNVWLELNGVWTLIVQNAHDADYILRRNHANYEKNMVWFRLALGVSRFFENGDAWKKHRSLTQPFLNNTDDVNIVKLSILHGEQTLQAFSQADSLTLDDKMFREMAMAVLIENFFPVSFREMAFDTDPIAQLMACSSEFSFIPAGESGTNNRRKLVQLRALRRHVHDSLAIFRHEFGNTPILAQIIRAEQEPDSQVLLEDELMTFLAAGSESTAAAMSWICYLLARYPDEQEKLYREICGAPEPTCWQDLSRMQRMLSFISEAMRLYPPIPAIIRQSLKADLIGADAVGAKENILISFIGILHDERHYPCPWEMNLSEHAGSPLEDKNSAVHTAFSKGPRLCGGKRFALIEIAGFVYTFLKHASFSLTSDFPPQFHWRSQMLRQGGQPVKVTLRTKSSR